MTRLAPLLYCRMTRPRMPSVRLGHQLGSRCSAVSLLVVGALVGWNLVVTRQLTEAHRSLVDNVDSRQCASEVGLLEHVAAHAAHGGAVRHPQGSRLPGNLPGPDTRHGGRRRSRLEGSSATPVEQDLLREARTRLDEYRRLVEAGTLPPGPSRIPPSSSRTCSTASTRPPRPSSGGGRPRSRRWPPRRGPSVSTALVAACLIGLGLGALAVFRVARPLHQLRTATQAVAAREFSGASPDTAGPARSGTSRAPSTAWRCGSARSIVSRTSSSRESLTISARPSPRSAGPRTCSARGPADRSRRSRCGSSETIQSSSRRLLALVGQIVELGRLPRRPARSSICSRRTSTAPSSQALDEVAPARRAWRPAPRRRRARRSPPGRRRRRAGPADRREPPRERRAVHAARRAGPGERRRSEEGEVLVRVADTGVGIPADQVPQDLRSLRTGAPAAAAGAVSD